MLALKISCGKWILLINEGSMKSPVGFAMSGSFCQANAPRVTLRVRVKIFSLVSGLLSVEGATGSLEKTCFALRLSHSRPSKLGFTEATSIMPN